MGEREGHMLYFQNKICFFKKKDAMETIWALFFEALNTVFLVKTTVTLELMLLKNLCVHAVACQPHSSGKTFTTSSSNSYRVLSDPANVGGCSLTILLV